MDQETIKAIQRIGAQLEGTLDDHLESLVETEKLLKDIDITEVRILLERYADIFLCEHCGWWCGSDEQTENENGETVCEECKE